MFPYDRFGMSVLDFKHTPRVFDYKDAVFPSPLPSTGVEHVCYFPHKACAHALPAPTHHGRPSRELGLREGRFHSVPVLAWQSIPTGIRVPNVFLPHVLVEHKDEVPLA